MFLAIETTTDRFSLTVGDGKKILCNTEVVGRKHADRLIPEIDKVLKRASASPGILKAIGAGTGPGSFTGIRIGLSGAITMAQVLDIPLYGLSSLDIAGKSVSVPVLKAFRDKVYWAEYDRDGKRLSDYRLTGLSDLKGRNYEIVEPDADDIYREVCSLYSRGIRKRWQETEPVYVMNTVYKKKKNERKFK